MLGYYIFCCANPFQGLMAQLVRVPPLVDEDVQSSNPVDNICDFHHFYDDHDAIKMTNHPVMSYILSDHLAAFQLRK